MYIYYDWLVKVAPFYPMCKFPASFCTPMENAWPEGEISWEEGLLFLYLLIRVVNADLWKEPLELSKG